MRVVIELKRGEESQLILNNLFKHTQMQESFGMILLSIVAGQPRELGLIAMIKLFIEHRMEVVAGAPSSSCAKPKSANTFWSATKSRSITWTTSSA